MRKHRKLSAGTVDSYRTEFTATVQKIRQVLGDRPFRPERLLNAAIADSVMVAVAEGIENNDLADNLLSSYQHLINDSEYLASTKGNTAQEEQVEKRLRMARTALRS